MFGDRVTFRFLSTTGASSTFVGFTATSWPLSYTGSLKRSTTGRSTESDWISFTCVARNWSASAVGYCMASWPRTPTGMRRSMSMVVVDSKIGVTREEMIAVAATQITTKARIFQRCRFRIHK